jgi:hypothetical protein
MTVMLMAIIRPDQIINQKYIPKID